MLSSRVNVTESPSGKLATMSVLLVDGRVRGLFSHQQNPLTPISEDGHYSLERELNSLDEPAPHESSRSGWGLITGYLIQCVCRVTVIALRQCPLLNYRDWLFHLKLQATSTFT